MKFPIINFSLEITDKEWFHVSIIKYDKNKFRIYISKTQWNNSFSRFLEEACSEYSWFLKKRFRLLKKQFNKSQPDITKEEFNSIVKNHCINRLNIKLEY